MSSKVVIIVPSQGHNTGAFDSVAAQLKSEVYDDAVIVKTRITDDSGVVTVAFYKHAQPFSWDRTTALRRVLTISHGMLDGPNLGYCDTILPMEAHQPWGTNGGDLTEAGTTFWTLVSRHMEAKGKIILLGCLMGAGNFARNVAKLTKKEVYAATNEFGAGNAKTALKNVRAIEKHKRPPGLLKFTG
jgi:hypothetical protein